MLLPPCPLELAGHGAYTASKAAAWSMTQSIRADLAPPGGIAVHAAFPDAVDTDMLADVDMKKTNPADMAAGIAHGVDDGLKDIFPEEMAKAMYQGWLEDHKAVEKRLAAIRA